MSDEITSLDLKSLQSRINDIKEEGSQISDFTIEYLKCLMYRHDLQYALPENVEFEDVPDSIIQKLRSGEIPTEDEIILMDSDTQNFLCFELVFFCGLYAIARYGGDEPLSEDEPSIYDIVCTMRKTSMAHYMGTYIISGLTLLMGQIPSQKLVEKLAGDFSEEKEQLQLNMDFFTEIASSILTRHIEDNEYNN
jgi:hypothetical protein